MQVDIVEISKLSNALEKLPRTGITGMLFTGDRLKCVEWAAVVYAEEKLVGITTVAPQGEENSGIPTIVGVYVLPDHRRRGVGRAMLKKVIQICADKGEIPLHIDVLSTNIMSLIESLDEKERSLLQVTEYKGFMDIFLEVF